MKKTTLWSILILSLLLTTLLISGCAEKSVSKELTTVSGSYEKIDPAQAKEMLESDPTVILVDVRTKEEYETGHIPNSLLLPQENMASLVDKMLPDKEKKIIVYCRSGRRSALAANQLIEAGYKQVFDLGGILDWPYEVVK